MKNTMEEGVSIAPIEFEAEEETTILKLRKDCEGKLTMEIEYPREIEMNGIYVSEELETAIIKELKEYEFGGAVNLINSCNRWDMDEA